MRRDVSRPRSRDRRPHAARVRGRVRGHVQRRPAADAGVVEADGRRPGDVLRGRRLSRTVRRHLADADQQSVRHDIVLVCPRSTNCANCSALLMLRQKLISSHILSLLPLHCVLLGSFCHRRHHYLRHIMHVARLPFFCSVGSVLFLFILFYIIVCYLSW